MAPYAQIKKQFRVKFDILIVRIFASIILLGIFFVSGGGVSHNEKWKINNVEINGSQTLPEADIRNIVEEKLTGNYFFTYSRRNSFLYPKNEIISHLLETFPRIDTVNPVRLDMHTISINISERKPHALWCGEEPLVSPYELTDCWFIDKGGFIFDKAPVFSKKVYLEVYGEIVKRTEGNPLSGEIPKSRFIVANNFSDILREEFGPSQRIFIKPEGETEITLNANSAYPFLEGVVIRFKDSDAPQTLLKNLKAALLVQFPDGTSSRKKLLYIDMRFGNKISFGFEN